MSTTTTPIQIPAGTYTVDPIHSDASFAVKHTVSTFKGSFGDFAVTLETVDGTPRLTGVVQTDSIEVRLEDLKAHLKSPEFFDVAQYPEIRFSSREIRVDGAGNLEIDGDLEIRGISKPVVATGTLAEPGVGFDGAVRLGIDLSTTVDRTQFGLVWNAPLPNGKQILGDDVTLTVHLELVAQEA